MAYGDRRSRHVEHEHAHPGEGEYLLVALFLAIVTGAEVVLYYVRLDFRLYAPLLGVAGGGQVRDGRDVLHAPPVRLARLPVVLRHRDRPRVTVYTIVLLTFHTFNGRA